MYDQEINTMPFDEYVPDGKQRQRRAKGESLSVEAGFVAFVFFAVLSQFILYSASSAISKPFRPLIVVLLAVMVLRRGRVKQRACTLALAMSLYQFFIWFFYYPDGGSLSVYLPIILYFMMLFSVASFPWNKRELQLILFATFLATFFCAVVFFGSNDMLSFSEHTFYFMGTHVNRNKNAYTFAIGVVLGWIYFTYGKGRQKVLVFLILVFEGYCLIYSQCRGAFLCAVLAFILIFLQKVISMYRRGNPYLVFYVLTFVFIIVVGYLVIKNSAVSRLVDSENLSGRDDGIKHAMELFGEATLGGKIFGNGALYEDKNTAGIGAHFVYLTYLLESGIIGAGIIVLIFVNAMKNMRGAIQWALFGFALLRTFFEGMDYYIFIPLILAICISNYEHLYKRPGRELFWKERF